MMTAREFRKTRSSIVTGAAMGIGRACAEALLQAAGRRWSSPISIRTPAQGSDEAMILGRRLGGLRAEPTFP